MSRRGACGRADLLRAFVAGGSELLEATAARLGYEQITVILGTPQPVIGRATVTATGVILLPELPTIIGERSEETPFWRPVRYKVLAQSPQPAESPPSAAVIVPLEWSNPPENPVPEPLTPWRELQPRLRKGLARWRTGTALDLPRILRHILRGQPLYELPRRLHRCWGSHLQIIIDRSEHLVPFWTDQEQVIGDLARLFDRQGLEIAVFHEGLDEPRALGPTAGPFRPRPGGTVLVLGDLGCLGGHREAWLSLGRHLAEADCRAVALLPAPLGRCPRPLRRLWRVLPWERSGAVLDAAALRERAERLLRLVSPAVRIEPGLLRAVRRKLTEADAATEADVWRHPAVTSTSSVAASLDAKAAKDFQAAFAKEEKGTQTEALRLLRGWHAALPIEIMVEEIARLSPDSQQHLPVPEDLMVARQYMARFSDRLREAPPGEDGAERAWFRRVSRRADDHFWKDPEIGEKLIRLNLILNPNDSPPVDFAPEVIPPGHDRTITLRQIKGELVAAQTAANSSSGSLLASLRASNDWLRITPYDPFWKSGIPPDWAEDWGWDEFGAWVTFTLGTVTQKMRWIKSGKFVTGSPKSEEGRWGDEGPQHDVTLGQGFWLFDTPCTQDLWKAVMGNNPSKFPGAERPVEKVNWTEVQTFLGKLNESRPGLDLSLPSEARWEYACRVGTTTARYSGDDAKTLESIAWYSNNNDRQTQPVKSKAANAWGLYDMLGNVLEWCADDWHDSYDGAPSDGSAWRLSNKLVRVSRGGSWRGNVHYVRVPLRNGHNTGDRRYLIGFRCSRVHVSPANPAAAEPADPAGGRQAERRPEQGPPSAAVMLRLDRDGQDRCPWPRRPDFCIDSDRERLSFSRFTLSDLPWAQSLGRDRFGLWAGIEIKTDSYPPVRQKMRWIPPGRFTMGSPPDEPGRDNNEGPQHEVTLGQGFWLFDTPCTQDLWSAVMGDNPSRFKSATRPVEQVSYESVQDFLAKINEKVSGLNLELPSEAHWEYACRAGTTTALYTGDITILGSNNAPALDPIAWYSGNSGEGFELDSGEDSKNWPEKQYPHEKAGTRPVGLKRPNAWGLHDMLGNVWEWCADDWHGSYVGAPTDGSVWRATDKSGRVVRGGSWVIYARHVRAACRFRLHPDGRRDFLGFRCSRVQS